MASDPSCEYSRARVLGESGAWYEVTQDALELDLSQLCLTEVGVRPRVAAHGRASERFRVLGAAPLLVGRPHGDAPQLLALLAVHAPRAPKRDGPRETV
jgi:hypothetical protein